MISPRRTVAVDLGKSRCRVAIDGSLLDGIGAPGLAASGGVEAALAAIRPLLAGVRGSFDLVGVGAAGAWTAPGAAQELASALAADTGVPVAVASDVVTAHAGALGGEPGVLLIAGTGAAALGIDADGIRLVDGWGPELGDFGSGSWLGREALRAVLRQSAGLAPDTALTRVIDEQIGSASAIATWLALPEPLPRRLATLAPAVLDAADAGDIVAGEIAADALRLLTASAVAASSGTPDVTLHGGLTDHAWFRSALVAALQAAGRRDVPAAGDALEGASLLARRVDLPHERFVHRAE
ncbi:MAG: BadF/BadG/BcrA/BcrD ATPase family protein [Candidatus Microbacterium colombiense]|nr:MAG: BadF/BadG/BcrA/BcrD ATPase family protein [Microbacterium sp.]